ncbi:hypothetical protein GWK47_041926 [Chionoecetes opilio]|uniref:Uncharacterized protein n=1 Tax=Chionoecetes opilio TaxID=41210 RepID=A0A8J5CWL2_CHIOP|nr:hypothetical protein GWK47_041926 [Chionoecetes opilio]
MAVSVRHAVAVAAVMAELRPAVAEMAGIAVMRPFLQLIATWSYGSFIKLNTQIRRHEPILELAEDTPEGEVPALNYHRKCRSIFTMKKALDGILAQKEKTTNGCPEDSNHARAGRAISSTSRIYEAECIFCQQTNKYAKRQKTREVLVKCRELRADAKIRNAATKKLDSRILGIVSRDIVAAEAH